MDHGETTPLLPETTGQTGQTENQAEKQNDFGTTHHKKAYLKHRYNVSRGLTPVKGKPRLLLFPGDAISKTITRPGSTSYTGLKRRRHRSTSALALNELSATTSTPVKTEKLQKASSHTNISMVNGDSTPSLHVEGIVDKTVSETKDDKKVEWDKVPSSVAESIS